MKEPQWGYTPDVTREIGGYSIRYWLTKPAVYPVVVAFRAPRQDLWICGVTVSVADGVPVVSGRYQFHENRVAEVVLERIHKRGGVARRRSLKSSEKPGRFVNMENTEMLRREIADTCAALAAVLRQSEVKR